MSYWALAIPLAHHLAFARGMGLQVSPACQCVLLLQGQLSSLQSGRLASTRRRCLRAFLCRAAPPSVQAAALVCSSVLLLPLPPLLLLAPLYPTVFLWKLAVPPILLVPTLPAGPVVGHRRRQLSHGPLHAVLCAALQLRRGGGGSRGTPRPARASAGCRGSPRLTCSGCLQPSAGPSCTCLAGQTLM